MITDAGTPVIIFLAHVALAPYKILLIALSHAILEH